MGQEMIVTLANNEVKHDNYNANSFGLRNHMVDMRQISLSPIYKKARSIQMAKNAAWSVCGLGCWIACIVATFVKF